MSFIQKIFVCIYGTLIILFMAQCCGCQFYEECSEFEYEVDECSDQEIGCRILGQDNDPLYCMMVEECIPVCPSDKIQVDSCQFDVDEGCAIIFDDCTYQSVIYCMSPSDQAHESTHQEQEIVPSHIHESTYNTMTHEHILNQLISSDDVSIVARDFIQ